MSDLWPAVTPLPGVARYQLRDTLRELHALAYNIWSGSEGSGAKQLALYIKWVSRAVTVLAKQVRPEDVNRLILTPGYDRLLSFVQPVVSTDMVSIIDVMLPLELQQRMDELEAACMSLEALGARWPHEPLFILPDTSVYITHEQKLEDLDLAEPLQLPWPELPVHIFMPVVVIDELDRLKDKGDEWTRWRAGYTLAVTDRLLLDPRRLAELHPRKHGSRGQVTIELVLDPPGHIRLPIADDEIVDRGVALQALTGQPLTVVTYDTGQSMRARAAGLVALKLQMPLPDVEPVSRRRERRDKAAARAEALQNGQADTGPGVASAS